MLAVQGVVRQAGMGWLQPEDFTIVARNEAIRFYVVWQAWIAPASDVQLTIRRYHGAEGFDTLCRALEEAKDSRRMPVYVLDGARKFFFDWSTPNGFLFWNNSLLQKQEVIPQDGLIEQESRHKWLFMNCLIPY
jgi:hypothetical protein